MLYIHLPAMLVMPLVLSVRIEFRQCHVHISVELLQNMKILPLSALKKICLYRVVFTEPKLFKESPTVILPSNHWNGDTDTL